MYRIVLVQILYRVLDISLVDLKKLFFIILQTKFGHEEHHKAVTYEGYES